MKLLASATAAFLALALAGCSSPGSSDGAAEPATATSAADASQPAEAGKLSRKDVQLIPMEDAVAKLDAAQVTYKVRIQGPVTEYIEDPQSVEPGKWKSLMLMNATGDGLPPEMVGAGDEVVLLVRPANHTATPTPTPTATAPAGRKITYVVTADGPILNTTFGNSIGGSLSTEQDNDVRSPFKKEYFFTESQLSGGFNHFSVSAQAGEGTTKISCQILSDGNELAKKTSTGPYAIVMCSS